MARSLCGAGPSSDCWVTSTGCVRRGVSAVEAQAGRRVAVMRIGRRCLVVVGSGQLLTGCVVAAGSGSSNGSGSSFFFLLLPFAFVLLMAGLLRRRFWRSRRRAGASADDDGSVNE